MSCWTSSSTRAAAAAPLLALLCGCALLGGGAGQRLALESVTRDRVEQPTAAETTIRWRVAASGGTGELRYEFRTRQGSVQMLEQAGPSPTWDWSPMKPGAFRVQVAVIDGAGERAESAWLPEIVVTPPLRAGTRVAVLPVQNLSGGAAPIARVEELLRRELGRIGLQPLDVDDLATFMERHRVRDVSGLSSPIAQAIRKKAGVDAVLVTGLEVYRTQGLPVVALISRLVSSGDHPGILWMDGVGLNGNAYPGFLNLEVVRNPDVLLERAVACLADSLGRSLQEPQETLAVDATNLQSACDARGRVATTSPERKGDQQYRPHTFFRAPALAPGRRYSVAVLPFLNLSGRKHADQVVTLHFVNQLLRSPNFTVVEPGLVREQLLKYRIIMEMGPSVAHAEVIASEDSLGVDFVCSGTVFDYQDAIGTPKVDFSVQIIDARSGRMVWSSRSYTRGDEGVRFFDVGRVYTAHRLASEMARGTFEDLAR